MLYRILKDTHDNYRTLQRQRIRYDNKLYAIEMGNDEASEHELKLIMQWAETYRNLEKNAAKSFIELGKNIPIIQDLCEIRGISYTLAAPLVAHIDIHEADTVSSLWRYAGIIVRPDGTVQRRQKGIKNDYNGDLRVHLYNIGSSFIKLKSPYADIYYNWKGRYAAKREGGEWKAKDYPNARLDKMARRKMIKIFLEHLWYQWRLREGLTVSEPWIFALADHDKDDYLDKANFGWPEV